MTKKVFFTVLLDSLFQNCPQLAVKIHEIDALRSWNYLVIVLVCIAHVCDTDGEFGVGAILVNKKSGATDMVPIARKCN